MRKASHIYCVINRPLAAANVGFFGGVTTVTPSHNPTFSLKVNSLSNHKNIRGFTL